MKVNNLINCGESNGNGNGNVVYKYLTMLGLVAEYLSIVPQQRKFVNPSTGDIVANSAKWKPDFSLIKAANAFRAIEQYAANLINQPWR